MIIGVPKEIKNHEYRVGMTPAGVQELTARGHKVLVQQQQGEARRSGCPTPSTRQPVPNWWPARRRSSPGPR